MGWHALGIVSRPPGSRPKLELHSFLLCIYLLCIQYKQGKVGFSIWLSRSGSAVSSQQSFFFCVRAFQLGSLRV